MNTEPRNFFNNNTLLKSQTNCNFLYVLRLIRTLKKYHFWRGGREIFSNSSIQGDSQKGEHLKHTHFIYDLPLHEKSSQGNVVS